MFLNEGDDRLEHLGCRCVLIEFVDEDEELSLRNRDDIPDALVDRQTFVSHLQTRAH